MKLNTQNANHLKFKYENILVEILGGINTESLTTLRVMLKLEYKRIFLRENIDLYNVTNTESFVRKVSDKTSLNTKFITEAINALTEELENYRLEQLENSYKTIQSVELTKEQQQQSIDFLKQPDLLNLTNQAIEQTGLVGNEKNRLIAYLIYLTRKQQYPLHAIIESPYNYLQNKLSALVPDEDKLSISHLSENAIFYFEENELSNKLIFVEDAGTNKRKLQPFFDLQTRGELSRAVPIKDFTTGHLRTSSKMVKGPICLSLSTPKQYPSCDTTTLSFLLNEDTSEEQDQKIMAYQRKQSAGIINCKKELETLQLLQNVQRILKPIKVINPHAELIVLPKEIAHKQITNAHYLKFIEAITFYKQYQREPKTNEQTGEIYIETTLEDIQQASELIADILLKKCDNLNPQTRLYFEQLKSFIAQKEEPKTFTNQSTSQHFRKPISTIKRYNYTLLTNGFLKLTGNKTKAEGYQYELVNQTDYQELKQIVQATFDKTTTDIIHKMQLVAEPLDEPLKTSVTKGSKRVAHDVEGGRSQ